MKSCQQCGSDEPTSMGRCRKCGAPVAGPRPAERPAALAPGIAAELQRLSPIASAFPDWDLLPPQGVVQRVKRNLC